MALTLGQLAVRFGCELHGDPLITVESVGTLDSAGAVLGFVASKAYLDELRAARVAAVVVDAKLAPQSPVPALVSANPHATFARIAMLLHPQPVAVPGIHPTALVHADAQVDTSAEVGPWCMVGAGARVGARVLLGPHCTVGAQVTLADDVRLVARVTVCDGVSIGARSTLHPGAVVGSDGFGYAREGQGWTKVPQVGTVRIGQDVEVGANTTIDRGAMGDTVIGDGVKLDNQIQIAHNVVIGDHTAVAACTGIAGSTRIGKRCMIGGGTGMAGHIVLGDDIFITGFGMVTRNIDKPGLYSSVMPVEEARTWRRIVGRIKRLDSMAARLVALEKAAGIAAAPQQENSDD
jgi:UDP-3-O-[3-hydroxymyristoyl] glucosamine N-acyltransferase